MARLGERHGKDRTGRCIKTGRWRTYGSADMCLAGYQETIRGPEMRIGRAENSTAG